MPGGVIAAQYLPLLKVDYDLKDTEDLQTALVAALFHLANI